MRKIIKIGLVAIAAVMACSCEDLLEVDTPTLEIAFADTERVDLDGVLHVYTNEVVTVNLSGDMDILYQYSGEKGSQYFLEDEVCVTGGSMMLQVSTYLGSQYSSAYQKENLSLWFSTDFTGVKDSLNICNATWQMIPYEDVGYSEKLAEEVWSNWLNMYDYGITDDDDYLTFAWRYQSALPTEYQYTVSSSGDTTYMNTVPGSTWRIYDFDFRRTYSDGRYQYYGLYDPDVEENTVTNIPAYAGFLYGVDWLCDGSGIDPVEGSLQNYWYCANTYYCVFTASTTAAYNYDELINDDWLVSRSFYLHEPPANDSAYSLKGTTEDLPESTSLYYEEAGTYTITIVAKNVTIQEEELVVKRLVVKVTNPDATAN